jgi:two-component system, cell cycle sensor histidine kinase and response regulator CckA
MSGNSDSQARDILIIDNDRSCRRFLARVLENQGYHPALAESAEQAREILQQMQEAPQLVITDVFLGKENGFELIRQIQQRFQNVKVLFTSGFSEAVLRDFGFRFDEPFIEKPICVKAMRSRLAALLEPAAAI